MGVSKIEICNIALALVGAREIRSFDEDNQRARMCDKVYESSRNFLLALFDWPFARAFVKLQQLDPDTISVPESTYAYQLPSDCVTPVDFYPRGTGAKWEVLGNMILTEKPPEVYLYYTKAIDNAAMFSDQFVDLLATHIAYRISYTIKQDKALKNQLLMEFKEALSVSSTIEANTGSEYRHPDENPDYDTFITGGERNITLDGID